MLIVLEREEFVKVINVLRAVEVMVIVNTTILVSHNNASIHAISPAFVAKMQSAVWKNINQTAHAQLALLEIQLCDVFSPESKRLFVNVIKNVRSVNNVFINVVFEELNVKMIKNVLLARFVFKANVSVAVVVIRIVHLIKLVLDNNVQVHVISVVLAVLVHNVLLSIMKLVVPVPLAVLVIPKLNVDNCQAVLRMMIVQSVLFVKAEIVIWFLAVFLIMNVDPRKFVKWEDVRKVADPTLIVISNHLASIVCVKIHVLSRIAVLVHSVLLSIMNQFAAAQKVSPAVLLVVKLNRKNVIKI